MQTLRPFIFWSFVALFFLTAALVLFYTFGYRFSTSRGIFIYTGSITVNSNPSTVSITLDGKPVPENRLGFINRSTHIPGIPPGEHFISVTAPGYTTWEKKAVVESGLSTEFWNVLLGKTDPTVETLAETTGAVRAYPSPKAGVVALAKKVGDEFSLLVYQTDRGRGEQVFSLAGAELLSEDEDGLEWSPDGKRVLVPLRQGGAIHYYVVDVETTASFELSGLTEDGRRKYLRWLPQKKHDLFYINEGTLYELDTDAPDTPPVLRRKDLVAYDLSGGFLYLLASNGIVSRVPIDTPDTQDARQITTAPVPVAPESNFVLTAYDDNRLAVLEKKSGVLTLYNQEPGLETRTVLLPEGARGMQFSDDGKKLLYFTEHEINVVFLRDWEVQPVRQAGMTLQVARLSDPVRFVQWTRDYEHVLFDQNGTVKVAELDNRDRRNIFDLAHFGHTPRQILSRFEENNVYFIEDRDTDERTLRVIQFPSPENFLGFGG
jgi:hypothetical protein